MTELKYDEGTGIRQITQCEETWLEWGFQASMKAGLARAERAAEKRKIQIIQDSLQ